MPRCKHHQTEGWFPVERQYFSPCRWPEKARIFFLWALAHTLQGSGSLHRLPKAFCILSPWFTCRTFCWPASQIKVFTLIKVNTYILKQPKRIKMEKPLESILLHSPPNVDSHTHTHLHIQHLEPKKWSRNARRAFSWIKGRPMSAGRKNSRSARKGQQCECS